MPWINILFPLPQQAAVTGDHQEEAEAGEGLHHRGAEAAAEAAAAW